VLHEPTGTLFAGPVNGEQPDDMAAVFVDERWQLLAPRCPDQPPALEGDG
jgi:hypothetical protein